MRSPAPVTRTYAALQGIFPLAAPLAVAALALYLAGQLLGALAPILVAHLPASSAARAGVPAAPALSPVPAVVTSAPANGRNVAEADARAFEALLSGRHAWLDAAQGAWPRPGRPERYRLDEGPRAFSAPEGAAANALGFTRALLGREYPAVEVLSVRLVTARHLGPEWPGSSVDGGVAAPSEDVLAERPAWLVLARTQDRVMADAPDQPMVGPLRNTVELLVIDATTGTLLLRPPAVLVDDFEAAIARLAYHPAQDRSRPLNYFGDAAP
ncbi:MAG TPA: hypothetical protein VFX49_01960 [Chloroflexota bacterium]|nr:hypothetical protein [Chloroflexota bacterium]